MRFRSTWILAILLVVIAAYYFLFEVRKDAAVDRERRLSRRIFPYDKNGIDRFVLINPQGDRVEIEKTYTGWQIVSPVVAEASKATIDAILIQLLPGRKLDSFVSVGNLDDYGLEDPYAIVIFQATDRPCPDTIFVGDKTPTSPSCYVRIGSSDTIFVAREITHNVVDKTLYHLRDKNFLHVASEAVDSLRVEDPDGTFSFSKRRGTWWIGDPPVRADRQLIEKYLNNLTLAMIYGFPGEDLSDLDRFGLDRPTRKMFLGSGRHGFDIVFGDLFEDQVYAVRSGMDKVLLLEQKIIEPFDWTMENVVSRRISFFDLGAVDRILIETPDTLFALERGPEEWRAGDAPVRQTRVQSILRMLQTIRFESIDERGIGDPPSLMDPFALGIALEGGGSTIERLSFSAAEGKGERAASLTADASGTVGAGTIEQLNRLVLGH